MSDLLLLRLHGRIPFARVAYPPPDDAKESIEIHRFEAVFDFGSPDGPDARLPGPASLLEIGLLDEESAAPDFYLDAGTYLFRQEREDRDLDLRLALRDYVRDAWWEGRRPGTHLILRRVQEDGKKALQILSPLNQAS